MEYRVSLTDRNKEVYKKIEAKFAESSYCAIVQATGTGKSYLAMELICQNSDKKILFLAPTIAILRQFKIHMAEEGLLGNVNLLDIDAIDLAIERQFPNLRLHTYHWFHFRQTSSNDLDNEDYDYVICDEYHHTGGEKWYLSFNDFQGKHPDTKYFGMSATPKRLDGQQTLFSFDNDVVNEYSLAEAIADGVLPVPKYIDFGIQYLKNIEENLDIVKDEFPEGPEKNDLVNQVQSFIRKMNEYDQLPTIITTFIPKISKILYFCPPSNQTNKKNNTKEIYEIYKLRNQIFDALDANAHYYLSFSDHDKSDLQEETFLNDDYEGLRVLYTVNKYNEGVHVENINCLILGRDTTSVSLFYQQLGRALSSGRNLKIQPIVLDLVGNIHIYQELVEEVRKICNEKVTKGKRLPNNQSLETFMNQFIIKDYEFSQSEFLERLKQNIQDNRQLNSQEFILNRVIQIENYCEMFKEFPKPHDERRVNENSPTSAQLRNWLYINGYFSGNFKYAEITDKNGVKMQERLDFVYKKYGHSNRKSVFAKIKYVDEIEAYCKKFAEFPERRQIKKVSDKSYTSNQLADWLCNSGYTSKKFKFANILDENGITLQERLDKLYEKYGHVSLRSDESKIIYVNNIEEYWNTFKEWPTVISQNKIKEGRFHLEQLYDWLQKSGYFSGHFKYSDVKDENGVYIKERLDKIYNEYLQYKKKSIDETKVNYVDEIEKYCIKFQEFPKAHSTQKIDKNSFSGNQLYYWLKTSGYLAGQFKYEKIVDGNGMSLQERLDRLFLIFAGERQQKRIENTKGMNLWAAKDSKNIGIGFYYLVIHLKWSYENHKEDMINYYKELINSKMRNHFINFRIEELISSFDLNIEKRLAYYSLQYERYSNQNNQDLAILFRNLCDYEKSFSRNFDEKFKQR